MKQKVELDPGDGLVYRKGKWCRMDKINHHINTTHSEIKGKCKNCGIILMHKGDGKKICKECKKKIKNYE